MNNNKLSTQEQIMNIGEYIQQGDILIKRIASLPEGLVPMKDKVLQESEITGHRHHFKPTAAVDLFESQGEIIVDGISTITPNFGKFIVVRETEQLFHGKGFDAEPNLRGVGDHKALTITPGVYEIDIVREWSYDENETVRVVD